MKPDPKYRGIQDWIYFLIILVAGCISGYGVFTNTGMVRWMNHAQQAVFGSHWWILSFVLTISVLCVLVFFVWDLVAHLCGADSVMLKRFLKGVGPDTRFLPQAGSDTVAARPDSMIKESMIPPMTTAFLAGDVYLHLLFEDAKFRYEKATDKMFLRFHRQTENQISHKKSELYNDSISAGKLITREEYYQD